MSLPFSIRLANVVINLAADVGLDSTTVDYVLRRARFEGLAFLTVTLPKLAKSVLLSLEIGVFQRPTDFAWKGKSLRHFRSFLDRIFDYKSGAVLSDVCPLALAQLRQFCEYFYKLANKFTPAQQSQAEENYLQIEEDCNSSFGDESHINQMRRNIERFYGLTGTCVDDVFRASRPRFGPGAFFGSEMTRNFAEYKLLPAEYIGTARVDQRPFSGYFKSYPSSPERITLVEEGKVSKVLFVPKDSRGPRVISKEPLHLLKSQMSFFGWMSNLLERSTNYRINFVSQRKNRDLALQGSIDRSWSTLDLKDASDRISLKLCKELFRNIPSVWYFVTRLRSTHTVLPSGRSIRLKKLSGMGSGITFPILALISHAAISTRVSCRTGLDYRKVSQRVYVYGDDVVVPREWYDFAIEGLTLANLRVNVSKSFTKGFFRESCGGDYYCGQDVTPVRLRLSSCGLGTPDLYRDLRIRFSKKNHANAVVQLNRHSRELWKNGLTNLARYYYSRLEYSIGPLPMVSYDSPVLGVYNPLTTEIPVREDYGYVQVPVVLKSDRVCSIKHLASFFMKKYSDAWVQLFEPSRVDVLGEVALPRRLAIKRKLVSYVDLTI